MGGPQRAECFDGTAAVGRNLFDIGDLRQRIANRSEARADFLRNRRDAEIRRDRKPQPSRVRPNVRLGADGQRVTNIGTGAGGEPKFEIVHGARQKTVRSEHVPAKGARGAAIRPGVGRIEATSQKLAGVRTEPPKSVPCARGTIPVATATAEPPEEPPDVSATSKGLRVGPQRRFVQTAPKPNSGVLVLPMITAPACRSLATTSSSWSGTWFWNSNDPYVVRNPLVLVRSFTAIGTPCRGPIGALAASHASA